MAKGTERGPSRNDRIRDEAERLLEERGEPMHISDLAPLVLGSLHLQGMITQKNMNTCLHDDRAGRFMRVRMGTWTLKRLAR